MIVYNAGQTRMNVRNISLVRWGIYGCFFLSGATALVFEMIWSRQFVTVFGNSPYAISTVLCAYMAGLGLGGLFGGRLADGIERRAVAYGVTQAGVAIWALAIPLMLEWLRVIVPTLSALSPESLWVSTLARFGMSFAILVVPCFLMGMTLPLLVRAVTESERFIGSRIGVLYCLNTLGAAVGCFAGGFWLVQTLSLSEMNLVAVSVNFAIAIVAIAMPWRREAGVAVGLKESEKVGESAASGGLLLTVAFLNGLAGLACEVLWIRYRTFFINSTYVFATVLCVYLLGMGLGGLIYGLAAGRIRRPAIALGIVEMLLAVSVPATFIAGALIFAEGPPAAEQVKMVIGTVFLPTALMGIAFPLLCAVYGRHVQALGRRTGAIFAVNTAGTVLGTLLPVFVLVPMMGIQMSIVLMSALYGVMGVALLGPRRRLAAGTAVVYAVVLLVLFAAVPGNLCQRVFLATDFSLARHTDILFYCEGRTGTAIVTRDRVNNCKTVYINGISEVPALYPHQLCFKMIGDLGPMLHPNPEEVLMICFGGGIAAGATTQLPEVKHLTIVDLESSVVEAASLLTKENNGLLANPKVHIVIDDGRNYLMMSGRRWPVIVSDSTHPKSGDSWVLYTQEFYRLVREHLANDGVFVQWVPTQLLRKEEFKIIVRTFESVFPHASLWVTHGIDEQCRAGTYSLLAATPGPLKIDAARMRERLSVEAVRRDLEPYGLHTAAGFLDTFVCAEEGLRRWAGEGPVNTDDLPYTQYGTRYARGAMLKDADLIEPMEDVWGYLTGVGSEDEANNLREELSLRGKVNRLALRGRLEEAYAVLPEDVRYRRMRSIYKQTPHYIETLAGIYRDNPQALQFLARLRAIGPGGFYATTPIYERLTELEPKNATLLNRVGLMRMNMGHLQAAEGYLSRAVRLSPEWAEAQDNLGFCLLKEGRVAEAIAMFRRAVEIRPTFRDARIYLAIALHKTGDTQEALAHLHYVLNMDPNDEAALDILAKIKGQSKDPCELPPATPQSNNGAAEAEK